MAKLATVFETLRSAIGAASTDYASALRQVETLKRQREDIAAAPAHRSDLARALCERIDRLAATYCRALDAGLSLLLRCGPDRLEEELLGAAPVPAVAARNLGAWHGVGTDGRVNSPGDPHAASFAGLIYLLGPDLVKEQLLARVETLSIPGEGLPAAERARKLAELDAKIEALDRELDELRHAAESAGLRLVAPEEPRTVLPSEPGRTPARASVTHTVTRGLPRITEG